MESNPGIVQPSFLMKDGVGLYRSLCGFKQPEELAFLAIGPGPMVV